LKDTQLEEKDDLAKYQEKVIERSLLYAPSPEESASIALKDNTTFGPLLIEFCTRLKISNIRIVKRIEGLVSQIYPILKDYDPRILKAAIHTLALLGWAHYSEHERAPSGDENKNDKQDKTNNDLVEFIIKKYGQGLYGGTKKRTDEEARWEAFLRTYEFGAADETDKLLNDGIVNGYFDESKLEELTNKSAEALTKGDAATNWHALWDRFHDKFDDDVDQFVEQAIKAFKQFVDYVTPADLNHLVKILKRLERNNEAQALLKLFMAQRTGPQDFFDLNQSFFGGQIDDPDVRRLFSERSATFSQIKEPHEILLEIYKKNGWNPSDMAILTNLTVDDYYRMFKLPLGDDHRRLIASALHFKQFLNPEPHYLAIVERAEEALRRIGKESAFNRMKVESYGI